MNHKMNRRDFLNIGVPATGAVLMAPGLLSAQLRKEVVAQFTGGAQISEYDVVINGAGLAGYFAAMAAAKKGLKVLIAEKRSFPGFDITAKRKLWLKRKGFDGWTQEMKTLFFPEGEKAETINKTGTGTENSLYKDHYLLLAGSVKKGLLRNLLINQIHVLLMTDVCGVFSDEKSVKGALLATKQGLYSVKCNHFIDASDNILFSRQLLNQQYDFSEAGFVLELLKAENTAKRIINTATDLGISRNQLELFPGKNAEHQAFIEFKFPVKGNKTEEIEIKAREVAREIGGQLAGLDVGLKEAIVHHYALECSYYAENNSIPEPNLKGHYLLQWGKDSLSCQDVLEIEQKAFQAINNLSVRNSKGNITHLSIPGSRIPVNKIRFVDPAEPGFAIPLQKCVFTDPTVIPTGGKTEVLVAGGGTAGAVAAIGALEKGAQAQVVDYFNDLGGTKTMGGVMGYYLGITDNNYIRNLESEITSFSAKSKLTGNIGRRVYFQDKIIKAGGEFISGSIICGTVTEGKHVKGITICKDGRLHNIMADLTIDATGDGDVAHFAGAETEHGNSRTGITQNYSQWNIRGGSNPPSAVNSDYDILDNTKISELQRGLFLSHYEAHFYDFFPYLTIRESRRVKGLYELNLTDIIEQTHFEDIIALSFSDFDPHFVGHSEFSRCGFLLPHSNEVTVEIPYRSIVPANLTGLLLSGKAISQTHDALQFTRMSADVTLLGYVTGQIAAFSVIEKTEPKDFDVTELQKEWFDLGYLAEAYRSKPAGNKGNEQTEINRRINELSLGKEEYLYECCKIPEDKALLPLEQKYYTPLNAKGKLLTAKALAWFGSSTGNSLIEDELKQLYQAELEDGYPEGYIEHYDLIRGKEKNVLDGLFWRINQNIALLGMSGSNTFTDTIKLIVDNTNSGGEIIEWTGNMGAYYNSRIDLRIIPFYNRILNLCFYAERKPHHELISGFEKLLLDENISGFITDKYNQTRWRVYSGFLELSIGAALARCGSKKGYEMLAAYMNDVHYNFRNFALNELINITGKNLGYDPNAWNDYFKTLNYPGQVKNYKSSITV